MKSTPLSALAIALWFLAETVLGAPPDQIRNSPIPPLKAPEVRTARRISVPQQAPAAPEEFELPAGAVPLPGQRPAPTPQNNATPGQPVEGSNYAEETEADYDAERAEIWNSPKMREARDFVMEYARRSAQSSEREGRDFLWRLSQLSPGDMRGWLERYEQQRMRLSMGRAVADNARELALEQAITRQAERQQAYANINQYQSLAAVWARETYQTRAQLSQLRRNAQSLRRDATVLSDLQQDFDPFYPTFDPMTPPRKIAAAASLPGDLPPGDPRNFIEGEEGIDTGAGTSPQDAASAASGGDPSAGAAPAGGGDGAE